MNNKKTLPLTYVAGTTASIKSFNKRVWSEPLRQQSLREKRKNVCIEEMLRKSNEEFNELLSGRA